MKQRNGFTLIEMLFALTIISVLTLLVVPNLYKLAQKQQTNKFFDVLEADVFYVQNQAIGTSVNSRIVFSSDHYSILNNQNSEEIKRYYPKHLSNRIKINHRIWFSNLGTIINPTTLIFEDQDTSYWVIFPLGKGRFYIEEK